MQQFIPFEDDWDALANLRPEDLVPYRVGMLKNVRVEAAMVFPAPRQNPPASMWRRGRLQAVIVPVPVPVPVPVRAASDSKR